MKKITFLINPKKMTVEIEVDGITGQSCTDLTKLLDIGEVVKEELKDEYYEEEHVEVGG